MAGQHLYFIAIIPPQEICDEITVFKKDFSERFQSSVALKVVPHITLKSPFKLPAEKQEGLKIWFRQLPLFLNEFFIELSGFGAFPNTNSPVVFVQLVMNEALLILQKGVLRHFRMSYPEIEISPLEFNFKPHMTVAYRDLEPEMFANAWKEYSVKKYQAVFSVNEFCLL
jgi:2'-5' RNA ligase